MVQHDTVEDGEGQSKKRTELRNPKKYRFAIPEALQVLEQETVPQVAHMQPAELEIAPQEAAHGTQVGFEEAQRESPCSGHDNEGAEISGVLSRRNLW